MISYKDKKVISIGTVTELTGLSERKIRYYEKRGLISPMRTERGTRKYSFSDIETLMKIADKREEGVQTKEIKEDMDNENKKKMVNIRDDLLRQQLNAHFNVRR
jgi:MerR family transcriptional regulator, global nitrogen regulator